MNIKNNAARLLCIMQCALCIVAATSCTDKIAFGSALLEKPSGATVTLDTVFNSPVYTEQYLNSIYALQYYGLPYNNKCGNAASPWTGKLDQLTDCFLMHWDNNTIWNAYYQGKMDATQMPLISYTGDRVWEAVRAGYILLDNVDNVPGLSEEKKAQFKAQAKCLIAARYFDLFAVYGGLPLVDHAYTGTEGSYDLPRASVGNTVDFMVGLLDDAVNSGALRWAYDGNDTETDAYDNTGRWTEAGAMALKAKILTFAASPLFNADQGYYGGQSQAEKDSLVWYGDFQQARWERALKACQDFFAKLSSKGFYKLTEVSDLGLSKKADSYRQAYRMGYASQGSKEILHSVRVGGVDAYKAGTYTWHQWLDNPARQNCLPTTEYVEMFPWSDGKPFNWEKDQSKITGKSGQLFFTYTTGRITSKTASRDPRLYEECIVNGQQYSLDWTTGKSSGDVYELWVGGNDAKLAVSDGTYDANGFPTITEKLTTRYATGFDQNKYYMNQDYLRKYTQWVYLSLDEMYLMYAECLAQCDQLQQALDQCTIVRARVGMKKMEQFTPSLKTDKAALLEEILRERACELGLSNNRYYDMIRYKRGDWMTHHLHGLVTYRLQQNASGEWVRVYRPWKGDDKDAGEKEPTRFEYVKYPIKNFPRTLWDYENDPTAQRNPTNREVAKWFLFPFPQVEINKGYGLVQNPGW